MNAEDRCPRTARADLSRPTIPTVYELSVPGRCAVDLPDADVPRARLPRGRPAPGLRPAGAVAARCGAPLSRLVAAQFRRGHGLLPARLVHDEIQSQGQRGDRPPARLRRDPSVAGCRHGSGQPRTDVRLAGVAGRDRRLCRRVPAAIRRRARRVHRPAHDARVSSRSRRFETHAHPDPQLGARHQPGFHHHGGVHRRRASFRSRAATSTSRRSRPAATRRSPAS